MPRPAQCHWGDTQGRISQSHDRTTSVSPARECSVVNRPRSGVLKISNYHVDKGYCYIECLITVCKVNTAQYLLHLTPSLSGNYQLIFFKFEI